MIPNGQNIPLRELEDLWKHSSADMTQSGKHEIFDRIPDYLLRGSNYTFFSTVNVPNGHSIIQCEFEEHRSNATKK